MKRKNLTANDKIKSLENNIQNKYKRVGGVGEKAAAKQQKPTKKTTCFIFSARLDLI